MSTRTKKKRREDVLAGPGDELQLYRAVRRYVKARGGSIVVIGGIELQQWPDDRPQQFRLAVKFLGRKPTIKSGDPSP